MNEGFSREIFSDRIFNDEVFADNSNKLIGWYDPKTGLIYEGQKIAKGDQISEPK